LAQLGRAWPRSAWDEYEEWSADREADEASPGGGWEPPQRMFVVEATSFDEDARTVADRFKRNQPVIVNLQQADDALLARMMDFCAGLAYALDGTLHPIVDRLFLLTPNEVEVSSREGQRDAGRAFFNRR
jgi:cell division inhibitor SepF